MEAIALTKFSYTQPLGETNSGESSVDLALYRPLNKRIEDYIRAGEVLEDTRRLRYHTDELEHLVNDDVWIDPLLYGGKDRMDIEQFHRDEIADILQRLNPEFSTSEADARIDAQEAKDVVNSESKPIEKDVDIEA